MKIKTFKILAFGLFSMALTACSDEMNYKEWGFNGEDYTKADYGHMQEMIANIYAQLDYDHGSYGGAFQGSATDESVYAKQGTSIETFYNGAWSPSNAQSSMWTSCYAGIWDANHYLKNFAYGNTFPELAANDDYRAQMRRYELSSYEVRALRAYYYFCLVRQYGDVPFYTDDLKPEEANALSRTPAKEVFEFIEKECDEIGESLPYNWGTDLAGQTGDGAQTGHVNSAMVWALKARTALYAASPLFNTGNDKELWKTAALANKKVLDYCTKEGKNFSGSKYTDIWSPTSADQVVSSGEIIFVRRIGQLNNLESRNFPMGVQGGNGGNCPSQTLVDAYEVLENGGTTSRDFDWNNAADAKNPCATANRDPRMAYTVAVNGETKWPIYNTTGLQTYYGGVNGEPLVGGTPTGYYLKKLVDGNVDLRTGKNTKTVHNWVLFRLGEFYLNYAEAVFNYLGSADATSAEFPMSAREAVNIVRARVKMPPLAAGLSNDEFRQRYEKERFVELAFEGHRFWDLRRWKEGKKLEDVKELKITKNADGSFTYTPTIVHRMDWNDKMYLFPIPLSEKMKNENLGQNPGWGE